MKFWRLSLLLFFILCPAIWASEFDNGLKSYEQGKFSEASQQFKQALKAGEVSGELLYDLGNSSFRDQSKLPEAVFYFRSALEWLPRDADLRFNLSYARKKVDEGNKDQKIGGEGILDWFPFSRAEALVGWSAITLIVFAFALLLIKVNAVALVWMRRIFVFIWLVWGVGTLSLFINLQPFGVIVTGDAKVYSGFGQNNALLFSLPAGTGFSVGARQGEWIQIQLPDGKKGWLAKADALISE